MYKRQLYSSFYEIETLLVLGRVASGVGGDLVISECNRVLAEEHPELDAQINVTLPDDCLLYTSLGRLSCENGQLATCNVTDQSQERKEGAVSNLLRMIGRRLIALPIMIFGVTILVFFVMALSPIDQAYSVLGENANRLQGLTDFSRNICTD